MSLWLKKNWGRLILCGGCLLAGFLLGMLIFGSPWHLPPAWGDIPTWVTAVATVGLLAGAIITAVYAVKAFRGQADQLAEQRKINAEQTKVLELQAAELRESLAEREREREQRHRAQAARVFITQERGRTAPAGYPEPEGVEPFVTATVVNTSEQPIYDAAIRWHLGPGAHGEPEQLGTIMPGDEASKMRAFPADANMSNSGAYVTFTDANSVRWLRRPDGYLNEFLGPGAA